MAWGWEKILNFLIFVWTIPLRILRSFGGVTQNAHLLLCIYTCLYFKYNKLVLFTMQLRKACCSDLIIDKRTFSIILGQKKETAKYKKRNKMNDSVYFYVQQLTVPNNSVYQGVCVNVFGKLLPWSIRHVRVLLRSHILFTAMPNTSSECSCFSRLHGSLFLLSFRCVAFLPFPPNVVFVINFSKYIN